MLKYSFIDSRKRFVSQSAPKQIQLIWLTTIDNIPDALSPEQENLAAAIWSAILRWRG